LRFSAGPFPLGSARHYMAYSRELIEVMACVNKLQFTHSSYALPSQDARRQGRSDIESKL